MLQTQVEVDDVLEGPVDRRLHGGRSGQAADLLEQVVVDVYESLGHERKYICSASIRIYWAAVCDELAPAVVIARRPQSPRVEEVDGDVHGTAGAHGPGTAHSELRPRLRRVEDVAALVLVLAGLGLVAIRWLVSDEGLPNAELAALAVGLPYSALGVLAFLGGRRGRPALMATSGATLGLICMVSSATILLLPVAIFLFARGVIGLGAGRQRYLGWEELCLSTVLPAAVLLAFGYLLLHKDPASWRPDETHLPLHQRHRDRYRVCPVSRRGHLGARGLGRVDGQGADQ